MPTHTALLRFFALAVGFVSAACSFIARDTPTYERDTSELLDTRTSQLQACYDQELTRSSTITGKGPGPLGVFMNPTMFNPSLG